MLGTLVAVTLGKMKVVAFDLGDTLVEYKGVPLSWDAHYREALASLASFLRIAPEAIRVEAACGVLRRYNTRINLREEEIAFSAILQDILRLFDLDAEVEELACATAFFRVFRQSLRSFPEVPLALDALRKKKIGIGVFTDVPYGMPSELVIEDIKETALTEYFDALLTSRCVGFRKPSPITLKLLAKELSCEPDEMVYVGNERKDIEVARAFGCYSVLIDRANLGPNWGQDRTIVSLSEI
jgi:putative hydrolase of the HAD superfamily